MLAHPPQFGGWLRITETQTGVVYRVSSSSGRDPVSSVQTLAWTVCRFKLSDWLTVYSTRQHSCKYPQSENWHLASTALWVQLAVRFYMPVVTLYSAPVRGLTAISDMKVVTQE